MNRYLLFHLLLLISLLAFSCKPEQNKEEPFEQTEATLIEEKLLNSEPSDEETKIDSSSFASKIDSSLQTIDPKKASLAALLENPLDLKKYKKKKRGANGSTFRPKPYDIKPDTVGHHYRYFWFMELRRKFRSESESTDATVVYSYIYGKEIGTYENVEEELVGIRSRIADEDMGKLDLVGQDASAILKKYDLERSGDYLFGSVKGDVLILHLSNSSVDWFTYRRTNLTIKRFEDIPPYLLSYRRGLSE